MQQRNSALALYKNYTILFIQKCQVPHNKLQSITLQACYHLHQKTAVMSGDGKSVTSIQESIGLGAGMHGVEFLYPGK
jgi:hypothetical protein